jgi:hypothetical protein
VVLVVVVLLDVVCFFLLPLSIYITVKGYSEKENWARIVYNMFYNYMILFVAFNKVGYVTSIIYNLEE